MCYFEKFYFNKLKEEFGVNILYFKIDVLVVYLVCFEQCFVFLKVR